MTSEGLVVMTENALYKQSTDIVDQLIRETDPAKFEMLTNQFKMNQLKKDYARKDKLSKLLYFIDDEAMTRVMNYPDSLDNDQLVKYMEATQRAISNTDQKVTEGVPVIQINQQNINVESSGLNKESRLRVLDAVNDLLQQYKEGSD